MNTLPFTPAMAKFFGVKQGSGVLVTQLSDVGDEKGPAEKAGIQPEDVIVGFDGMKIEGVQDFRLAVANTPPNKTVKIRIVQHGKEKELEVTLAERKFEEEAKGYSFADCPRHRCYRRRLCAFRSAGEPCRRSRIDR